MSEPRKYMRAGELAHSLGVTARTVRRWIATGAIPSVKIGGTRLVPLSAFESSTDFSFLDEVEATDDEA
jgi:excisionase family DNA binding protein